MFKADIQSSNRHNSALSKLTSGAVAKIPDGLSNLTIYIHRDESYERMFLGHKSRGAEIPMALKLAAWEADWKAMGGK